MNGVDADYTRTSDKAIEAFKLHITPETPVEGEFTVVVEYSGVPVRHIDNDGSSEGWVATADGTTALGQPVGTMAWIPSNNTPADKATFDFRITIPTTIGGEPAAAASNGELIERTPSADGTETTWVWRQQHQQATMVTMLSIGNFHVREGSITLTDGRVIPEWSFLDTDRTEAQIATMDVRRGQIEEMTTTLEGLYGPYPGSSTGVVVDVNPVGYALETQDRSFFPGSISESTLVHEIAHQWYGNAISPADWGSIWVSEGQGTYAPVWWREQHGLTTTAETYFDTWNRIAETDGRWQVAPGAMPDQVDLYGWHSYTRAAMTYEVLRQVVGDEVFVEIMTGYVQTYNGTSRTGDEFIAYAEEIAGRSLQEIFQPWIYESGKPEWPSVWDYSLAAEPVDGEVEPGSTIAYTLTATNTGLVPLTGGAVTVDLADVLDDATIDAASLPEGLALDGTDLVWTVPETELDGTAEVVFTATVADDADGASLAAASSATLGAFCVGECATAHSTAETAPIETPSETPSETAEPTAAPLPTGTDAAPAPQPGDGGSQVVSPLPQTGAGAAAPLLVLALGIAGAGGALLARRRRA